jgi:hypothetical protein
MISLRTAKSALPRFACVLAVCLAFASADSAMAQRAAGGGGPRPGGKGGPKQPANPRQPSGPKTPSTVGTEPGSFKGQISDFKPAAGEKDEELIGTLTIRPTEKGAKTVKLVVRKSDNLVIQVGTHKFEPEACAEVFWKGLYCVAEWDWCKEKPTVKELKTLTFDSMSVEGKIEAVEGEFVTLKVSPSAGREWPDAEGKEASRQGNETAKPKRPLAKKLKLKIFDEVALFLDGDRKPLDMGDFSAEQTIKAVVVYGKKEGILVELQSLTSNDSKEGQPSSPKPSGPTPQQPPGSGPQPRGGRGGRG